MQENNESVDQRAFKNVVPIAIWTLAWVATLALARFGPDLWDSQPVASWVAIAANVGVGIGVMVAHAGFLRRVDELQRKILVDAMAVALGVGLVGGFAYAAADSAGLFVFDANIAFFSALMAVVYAVATIVGTLRYR